jgi:hypothetical protein
MLWGVDAVFAGKVARYAANSCAVIELNRMTLTVQVAVILLSTVVTVMIALPSDTAVTTPLADTLATEVALLFHDTDLFVALLGATIAVKVSVPPTLRLVDDLFSVTPVTEI